MHKKLLRLMFSYTLVCVFVGWFWLIFVFVRSKSFSKKKGLLEFVVMTSFTLLLSGIYLLYIGFKNKTDRIATLPSQVQHI